jgi:hypothetical protein
MRGARPLHPQQYIRPPAGARCRRTPSVGWAILVVTGEVTGGRDANDVVEPDVVRVEPTG